MKGLVVEAAGKICLREDQPLPEIDAYQVLCRNVGCGICNGTDMQLINGQMPFIQYPFVLGHEAVGQVVAVGERCAASKRGTISSARRCLVCLAITASGAVLLSTAWRMIMLRVWPITQARILRRVRGSWCRRG